MYFFIPLLLLAFGCNDEEISNPGDPSDLDVNIEIQDHTTVFIQATAQNTIEYQFRLGNATDPTETNTSGIFEHTYDQPGNYTIDIRAYGSSGRFLREEVQFTITIPDSDVNIDQGYTTPLTYDGWDLVWHDEFEGNSINTDYWVFESGDGCPNLCGWGNNEWQYYRQQNAWVGDGVLTIEARQENFGGSQYTSTRMKTQGKKSFQYGRVDIRALLPKGQGIWPALWMLGDNISSVGWPACGEIDIMEMIGGSGREKTVHGTLHWDTNGHAYTGGSYSLPSGTFADEYHVFSIIWDETSIRWFVNDNQYHAIDITPSHMSEFHNEFFFIFNIAVGGNWPGYPDETTIFPQQMRVDYIRMFQQQ
ncbi:MAG: glycoside hydrolase family 16 protein [Bacteroidota bacterium]